MFKFTDERHSSTPWSSHFSHDAPLNEAVPLLNETIQLVSQSTDDTHPTDAQITQAPDLDFNMQIVEHTSVRGILFPLMP